MTEEQLQKKREYNSAYYEKNKETVLAARREYLEKNKETVLAYQREYRHPTEIVAQLIYVLRAAKTRAKRRGIKFKISLDEALHIYYSQNGKCAYSKKTFTMGIPNCPFKISPDQIIPGGGYTKENIQFVTSRINIMKRDASSEEFVQVITDIYKNLNSN